MIKAAFFSVFMLIFSSAFSQEIIPLDKGKLEDLLKNNKGKPVLVNLWATWCKPCVEEFPELLKIKQDFADKQLEVILISLDFGEDAKEKTMNFLNKMGVDFETYSNAFEKDEDLINVFDNNWNGAIPATFIYDKDGKLKSTLIGKRSYEVFKTEVEKVM